MRDLDRKLVRGTRTCPEGRIENRERDHPAQAAGEVDRTPNRRQTRHTEHDYGLDGQHTLMHSHATKLRYGATGRDDDMNLVGSGDSEAVQGRARVPAERGFARKEQQQRLQLVQQVLLSTPEEIDPVKRMTHDALVHGPPQFPRSHTIRTDISQ